MKVFSELMGDECRVSLLRSASKRASMLAQFAGSCGACRSPAQLDGSVNDKVLVLRKRLQSMCRFS